MRKIAYVEYRLNIAGLYAMGVGWLKGEYAVRWNALCDRLHERCPMSDPRSKDSIFVFENSVYAPDSSSLPPRFFMSNFDAYMHGMEVVGHYASSKYCPNDHLRAEEYVKTFITKLAKKIRDEFDDVPNLELDYKIKVYHVDLDDPNTCCEGVL
jgi:hypothetical protein